MIGIFTVELLLFLPVVIILHRINKAIPLGVRFMSGKPSSLPPSPNPSPFPPPPNARIGKSWLKYPFSLLIGVTIYIPPVDADFDSIQKSQDQKEQANKGTKPGKKEKTASKPSFPMRTIEIGEEVLNYVQDFLVEYDFIFLLITSGTFVFLISGMIKSFLPG